MVLFPCVTTNGYYVLTLGCDRYAPAGLGMVLFPCATYIGYFMFDLGYGRYRPKIVNR